MTTIPEIKLSGNAYQRGLQHGQICARQINNFLQDNRARINTIREYPLAEEIMQNQVRQHAEIIEAELPQIAEELRGLAAGANISYEDAVLLQIRVELIAFGITDILEGDCSTIANVSAAGEIITGQTIDLPGNLGEMGCVFKIIPEHAGHPQILMYGFAGLLGYMGMNSLGVSININMVVSKNWQPGVSPYLLVRHLLNFSSADECINELKKIRRSSSRSLIISDPATLINVEFTANELSIVRGKQLIHTNHYLHAGMMKFDSMHFLFKNSSVKRWKLMQQLLPDDMDEINPELLFKIFSDHTLFPVGICAHSEGNIRRSETIATVVMQPASFIMYARKGNACSGVTEKFGMIPDLTL